MKRSLVLSALLFIAVFIFNNPQDVSAIDYPRTNGFGCQSAGDNALYPFGFMCGTHADYDAPLEIKATRGDGTEITPTNKGVQGGSTLSITLSWSGVTGSPRRNATNLGNPQAAQNHLVFATMNTQSSTAMDGIHPINISSGGNGQLGCPGDGSKTFNGSGPGPGKVWGDRDLNTLNQSPNYGNPQEDNGINQSPYAYNTDTQRGVINCEDDGRMVYWIDGTPSTNESFTFDLRIDDGFDASNICLRGNLSTQFDNDNRWFPPSGSTSSPPGSGGAGSYSAAVNQRITATHLVKQSRIVCFDITTPPPVNEWRATMQLQCDKRTGTGRIYGVITRYANGQPVANSGGRPYALQYWENSRWNYLATGSASDVNDRTYSVDLPNNSRGAYSSTRSAANIFGHGETDRLFRLEVRTSDSPVVNTIVPEVPPRAVDYYTLRRDCAPWPVSLTASGHCINGITGRATDNDIPNQTVAVAIFGQPYYPGLAPLATVYTDINGNYTWDVSAFRDGLDHAFHLYGIDDSGWSPNTGPIEASFKGCGNFQVNPDAIGVLAPDDENPSAFNGSNTFTAVYPGWAASAPRPAIQAGYSNSITKNGTNHGGPYPSGTANFGTAIYALNASIAAKNAGDLYCSIANVTSNYRGIVENNGNILRIDENTHQDIDCQSVKNKPYFKVYGSGVSVGNDFSKIPGCGTTNGVLGGFFKYGSDPSNIYTWGRGSSVEWQALAEGNNYGVASRQVTPYESPTELTFSNSGITVGRDNGDVKFGEPYKSAPCLPEPDYSNSPTIESLPGNRIDAPINLSGSQKKIIQTTGNVYINANITYSGNATPGNAPDFQLVTTGNIYIAPGVTELYGKYYAVPTNAGSSDGRIYTCATATGPYSVADVYSNCAANQLTVHGNFIARKVVLNRTYGSLRDEIPNPGASAQSDSGTPGISQKMVWVNNSDSKPTGYKKCVQVQENKDEDDDVWGNNWLCLSTADEDRDINLVYSHENKPSGVHCPILSVGAAIELATNFGLIDEKEEDSWDNNWLCTDEFNTGILVAVSLVDPTDTTRLCTALREPDDDHADNVWNNTSGWRVWACMNKYVAGPPTEAKKPTQKTPLMCSIPSGQQATTKGTCAAEIFRFNPSQYLAQPIPGTSGDKAIIFDSITSLPPVL